MPRQICTAVAAAASGCVRLQIIRALADAGMELSAMAQDASSVPELLRCHRPDLLLADMQLPLLEGSSLARRVLCSKALPVRPVVILLYHESDPLPDRNALEAMGAVFSEKPLTAVKLRAAIERLQNAPPFFPPEEAALADRLLDELGFPQHIGRSCLKTAVLLCASDERLRSSLTNRLYPLAAELNHTGAPQAVRAMRHAIDLAWRSNKLENQHRIFADTVDAGRGQPTCGEMISRLADILRSEG